MKQPKQAAPVPITNNTKRAKFVGGRLIPPGQTRLFNPGEAPGPQPTNGPVSTKANRGTAPAKPKEPPKIGKTPEDLVANTAKDIIAAVPELSDADLQALEQLEEGLGKKARKSVLEAIQSEQLERAHRQEFAEQIAEHDNAALIDLHAGLPEGGVEAGLAAEEIERRKAAFAEQEKIGELSDAELDQRLQPEAKADALAYMVLSDELNRRTGGNE